MNKGRIRKQKPGGHFLLRCTLAIGKQARASFAVIPCTPSDADNNTSGVWKPPMWLSKLPLLKNNLMGNQESIKVLGPLGSENAVSKPAKKKGQFSLTIHKKHLPSHSGLLFTDLKCLVDNELLNFKHPSPHTRTKKEKTCCLIPTDTDNNRLELSWAGSKCKSCKAAVMDIYNKDTNKCLCMP